MTGEELYYKLSVRDYSGSEADEYAQLLDTIHGNMSLSNTLEPFYKLLEKAHAEGKKLDLREHPEDVMCDEYFLEDIIVVA